MMHLPPVSDSPYFKKNFRLWKIFKILPLIFPISSAKISDLYFFPPIFSVSVHFPRVSRKLLFPPYFEQFPPVFQKFTCLLHTLCVFRFPPTLTMMQLCITQCTYWTSLCECFLRRVLISVMFVTRYTLCGEYLTFCPF